MNTKGQYEQPYLSMAFLEHLLLRFDFLIIGASYHRNKCIPLGLNVFICDNITINGVG